MMLASVEEIQREIERINQTHRQVTLNRAALKSDCDTWLAQIEQHDQELQRLAGERRFAEQLLQRAQQAPAAPSPTPPATPHSGQDAATGQPTGQAAAAVPPASGAQGPERSASPSPAAPAHDRP